MLESFKGNVLPAPLSQVSSASDTSLLPVCIIIMLLQSASSSCNLMCCRVYMIHFHVFPRSGGGRGLQPKDLPPNIFVKIIHYIARVSCCE